MRSLLNRSAPLLVFALSAVLAIVSLPLQSVQAVETWEKLDKRLKQQVYQINVAVKLKKQTRWVYQML